MGVKSFYNKNKKYVILLLICLTVQMIYGINIYQDATSTIIDFFVRLIINTLLFFFLPTVYSKWGQNPKRFGRLSIVIIVIFVFALISAEISKEFIN